MRLRAACAGICRVLLSFGAVLLVTSACNAVTIGTLSANGSNIGLYDKFELTFNLSGAENLNPFRTDPFSETFTKSDGSKWDTPGGVDVWAQVTTPGGKVVRVYGFWDTDFEYLGQMADYGQDWSKYDKYVPASAPHWNIRYAPSEVGAHKVQVFARDSAGTASSPVVTFNCQPSARSGFVKVSEDGQRFVRSDGSPFIAFMGKAVKPENFAASGINTVRTWITNSVNTGIFEEASPQKWILSNASYDTGTRRSGRRSVRGGARGTFLTLQKVPVRNASYYNAFVWLRTDGSFNGTAAVQVTLYRTDGSTQTLTGNTVGSGSGWTKSSINFSTSASGKTVDFVDYKVTVLSGGSGSVWADDAGLYECNSNYSVKVDANYLWQPSLEEWNPSQLRLMPMWRLEKRFTDYDAQGITQQLCIYDFKLWDNGFYSNYINDNWWDINSQASKQADMALRYLVARFGHYRSLFAYELTNEMDPNWSQERMSWIKDKADYIHSIDPYGHMVTNSYWNSPACSRFEQLSSMDLNEQHYYMMDEAKSSQLPMWGNLSSGVSIDTNSSNARSGKKSLRLSGGTQKGTVFLKPSAPYTFKFWAKPQSAVDGRIREYDETGRQLSSRQVRANAGSSYTQQSLAFTTASATASVDVEFYSSGTAWVDDVELVEGGTGRSILYNGGFEASRLGDDEFEWSVFNTLRSRQIQGAGPRGVSKPWVGGEFGLMGTNWDWSGWINPKSSNVRHDSTGIHLHNTLWAIFMANSGIQTPCYWWTAYIDNYNLWPVWKGVTQFAKNLPFYTTGKTISTDPVIGEVPATASNSALRVLGQKQGNSAYLWIQNSGNTWANVVKSGVKPGAVSGTVSISGFVNGSYTVDWYNTVSGSKISSETVSVSNGKLQLGVSSLSTDIAAVVGAGGAVLQPDISLNIASNKSKASPGEVVTYTITFTNKGEDAALNMQLHFPVPSNTSYVNGSAGTGGSYSASDGAVVWTVPSVAAGASGQRTVQVTVN
jgi:uncharacterized repeat protein (TIGR01451 family)